VSEPGGILAEIARRKRWEREVLRDALRGNLRVPPESPWLPEPAVLQEARRLLRAGGCEPPTHRPFAAALDDPEELRIIAEIKRRSPSAGSIASWEAPEELAASYARGGAAAVSVLTDAHYFDGRPGFLPRCRKVFPGPVLRKDFLDDELDLAISAALGADAVLGIVALLGARSADFLRTARCYGLEVLLEVHDRAELDLAMACGAGVIGINNRDLKTFRTDLGLTERLGELIPPGAVLVAESGIRGAADAARMRRAGAHAVLVGESLARSEGEGLPALRGRATRGRAATVRAKVCGLTQPEQVHAVAALGARFVGFVLAPSPRRATRLQELSEAARQTGVQSVGVFVNAPPDEVLRTCTTAGLDVAQLHGEESPSQVEQLAEQGVRVWKALRVGPSFQPTEADDFWYAGAEAVLLDRWHPQLQGGTGEPIDWDMARRVAERGRVILAGGLSGENVARAVETVAPWGVDASSALESAPGIKDLGRVAAFVRAASGETP